MFKENESIPNSHPSISSSNPNSSPNRELVATSSTSTPSRSIEKMKSSHENSDDSKENNSPSPPSPYPFRLTPTKSLLIPPDAHRGTLSSTHSSPFGSPSSYQIDASSQNSTSQSLRHVSSTDNFHFFHFGTSNDNDGNAHSLDKIARRKVRKWEKILDHVAHQKPSSSFDIQFESAFIGSSMTTQVQNGLMHVEQEYFTGAMLRNHSQISTLKNMYQHILTLSTAQWTEKSGEASLSLAKEQLVAIYHALMLFSRLRVALVDMYAALTDQLWLNSVHLCETISDLQAQRMEDGNSLNALAPMNEPFGFEMDVLDYLLRAEVGIRSHKFKDAVVNHHLCQKYIHKWETFLYSSSATKRVRASGENSILQYLKDILDQQHTKIGLYFSSVINERSAFANRAPVRRVHFQEHSYYQNIRDFCDRNNVAMLSILYMMPKDSEYQVAYTCPGVSDGSKPVGIKSFPPLLCIPNDIPWKYWPGIISLLQTSDMYPKRRFFGSAHHPSQPSSRLVSSVFSSLFSHQASSTSSLTFERTWETPSLQHGEYILFLDKVLTNVFCICGLDERVVLAIVLNAAGVNGFPEQEVEDIFGYLSDLITYRTFSHVVSNK